MQFLLAVAMLCGGGYLLLSRIIVIPNWGFGAPVFTYHGWTMTTGMIFIPFLIGVCFMFYNARNWIGWLLTLGSIVALVFGVLANLNVHLTLMSAFDLVTILVLTLGGLGLLLRSLKNARTG